MRERTCCFTGHHVLPPEKMAVMLLTLYDEVEALIHRGVDRFACGGGWGFDTLAELTVLMLKREYPHIRLILVLPCEEHCGAWDKKEQEIYNYILSQADEVIYTADHYYNGCMHKRNRHLVDMSNYCIAYRTKQNGSSAYTMNYAQKEGLNIINLASMI